MGNDIKFSTALDEARYEVSIWQRETFGDKATLDGAAKHLSQEAVEVLGAVHYMRGADATVDESILPAELADVFIMLVHCCTLAGVDLDDAVRRKLAINRLRQWREPDAHGVINHVDDEKGGG